MPARPEATWGLLADIETVAACLPGAKITERLDATHYKGTVTVRVGPATLAFRGTIDVKERDATQRTLRVVATGTDTTGSSAASLDLTARVDATAEGQSALVGNSAASVSGKAAAFGGRMMETVADQILKQFAANFAARVATGTPTAGPMTEPSAAAAATPAPATPGAPRMPAAVTNDAASPQTAPVPAALPQPNELNGLALAWAVLKDWLRGLFGKKLT
jgi:hypothetical protein